MMYMMIINKVIIISDVILHEKIYNNSIIINK